MDVTIKTLEGKFNYRVTAIIINDNKLLAINDLNTKGYYLPGGRVKLHETLIDAIKREVKEELNIDAKIERPLWIVENFFYLQKKNEKVHELGVYYLIDIKDTDLLDRGNKFIVEEDGITHIFEWLDIDSLENTEIYPLFIRNKLKNIKDHIEMFIDQ